MTNKLLTVAAISLVSALSATGVSAHVANGVLVDGSNQVVKDGSKKCIIVADGSADDGCHPEKPAPVAAPAPTPAPAPAPKEVSKVASLSGDALFATDSAQLSDAGKAALDDFAFRASAFQITNLDVVGHADSRGAAAYNLDLSVRRAVTVKNYLVSKGIDSDLIFASGKGETDPVATNDTPEGRAQNRRVDITVTGITK